MTFYHAFMAFATALTTSGTPFDTSAYAINGVPNPVHGVRDVANGVSNAIHGVA